LFKNNRKVNSAYVWHENEIKKITKDDYEFEGGKGIILNNQIVISKSSVRLVQVGDEVTFKRRLNLPERCKPGRRKITYIMENGGIGTDKDLYSTSDSSAYTHFERWNE
jgi:hypothetical protein